MDILQTSGVTFLFNHSALHFMPHFSWLPNIKVEHFVSDKNFITNAFPWFENKTLHAWFGIRQRRLPIPWKQKAKTCIWTHNVPDPALTHKEMRSHLKIFFFWTNLLLGCNRELQQDNTGFCWHWNCRCAFASEMWEWECSNKEENISKERS